ncbi:DUF4169 family protein [Rhodobacteraceae bacterium]|nr:DUF4169 family protein [Paracoccaceae bacterium]
MKPINLNQARKARARTDARAKADQNAVKFGRSRAEKTSDKADAAKTIQTLDNAKRDI